MLVKSCVLKEEAAYEDTCCILRPFVHVESNAVWKKNLYVLEMFNLSMQFI